MTRAKKILLVDDDELLRDTLVDQFSLHDEYAVEPIENANAAIERVKEEAHIDLMLLDVGLPDMDGREACRIMRKNGFKSPIIMLTGADSDADTILGARSRRKRLCGQTIQVWRSSGPRARPFAQP